VTFNAIELDGFASMLTAIADRIDNYRDEEALSIDNLAAGC
jgi:hypothetical protein